MKKLYKFTHATIVFCVVMSVSLSLYKENVYEPSYVSRTLVTVLDLVVKALYMGCGLAYLFFVACIIDNYVKNYESSVDKVKMYHGEAEISWTEVERDDEGDEIARKRYGISFIHNICRDDNDPALAHVIEVWHTWRRNNDCIDKRSTQDFCDFVNVHTMYNAAPTKEEFHQLLKGKA